MGAWDFGVFDDDTAYDVMDELKDNPDIEAYLENAFDTAIAADYLDYDEGIAVSVCGAVLDSILNGTGYRFDGFNGSGDEEGDVQYMKWTNEHKGVNAARLKEKAVAALRRFIHPDSELYELWSDNEELFPKWKESIEQMICRLSA